MYNIAHDLGNSVSITSMDGFLYSVIRPELLERAAVLAGDIQEWMVILCRINWLIGLY